MWDATVRWCRWSRSGRPQKKLWYQAIEVWPKAYFYNERKQIRAAMKKLKAGRPSTGPPGASEWRASRCWPVMSWACWLPSPTIRAFRRASPQTAWCKLRIRPTCWRRKMPSICQPSAAYWKNIFKLEKAGNKRFTLGLQRFSTLKKECHFLVFFSCFLMVYINSWFSTSA